MTSVSPIKSKAARVLSDDTQDADSKSVAAFVLGSDIPKPKKTRQELQRLRQVIAGREGQHERVQLIDEQLASMS